MKRKREKDDIDLYIDRVDAKEIDGEYDSVDLLSKNHSDRDRMKKCMEKEKFEIHALLYNGKPTGYGSCTSPRCRKAMWMKENERTFQVQLNRKNGSKWQLIERHLIQYHESPEEKAGPRQKPLLAEKARQTKIDSFTPSKKLPQSVIDEMRQQNINVVSRRHTSLNFFSKDDVRERDRTLLKAGGFNPDEVLKFDRTGPTVKKDLERNSAANKQLIAKVSEKLADHRLHALAIDFHDIKNLPNQKIVGVNPEDGSSGDATRSKSALGFQLILCAPDESRIPYLMGYIAVTDKTNSTTLRLAREVLQESA